MDADAHGKGQAVDTARLMGGRVGSENFGFVRQYYHIDAPWNSIAHILSGIAGLKLIRPGQRRTPGAGGRKRVGNRPGPLRNCGHELRTLAMSA